MSTGYRGAFVISWTQTELDGLTGATVGAIGVGSIWRWSGSALRIDAPRDVLVLERPLGADEVHRRAASQVRRLVGRAIGAVDGDLAAVKDHVFESGFSVTDGNRRYRVTLIPVEAGRQPLLLFVSDVPPADTDLWVVDATIGPDAIAVQPTTPNGTICFTPGTRIATPNGPCLVEELQEGDRISTRDSGSQPIEWIGSRRVTGARMHAMPHLRPIRLRAHVMGQDEPDADLLVSPDHRVLLRGAMANALFNTDEVLVAAKDLVNDRTVTVDHALREVTYIHLLLPAHQIVWANGLETESFHPAFASLQDLSSEQHQQLHDRLPDLKADPFAYGDPARRALTGPEAALIRHEMA